MANAEGVGHKAEVQGVAYFAPDGSNLGATIYLARSRTVTIFRLMNVLTFIILTWSFSDRYSLPWPLLPASLGLIALGMLVFERKRLELYGDVVVGPGGVRLRWAEVSQFTSLFGTRPWGQSHLPEIGALLSNGSTITVAAPYGEPTMVAAAVDFLNRFRTADEAGRMELIRPFRVEKLTGSKRP